MAGPRPQPPCPGSRRPGLCWPYLELSARPPHLGWRSAPPSPRGGTVPRLGGLRGESTHSCAVLVGLYPRPLTPCRGGGVRERAGKGGRAGAQVCSFIRAGRRREQHPSSGWRRRQTRRCHCRCPLRATPGSPAPPEPPRSTPLSISGAPRRSSSLRRLTVGCSFRTRPRRPSARPGEFLARALHRTSSSFRSSPATRTLGSSPPVASL